MNASSIHCLITAGPTREYLDPVRYFSNGSSGKMGYALAEAAVGRGWEVDLVSGPVSLPVPAGVALHKVVSAEEMLRQTEALFERCDLLIMTAAVADYRPVRMESEKMKKTGGSLNVELEPTVDILRTLASRKGTRLVVGFAAETTKLEDYARRKLEEKNLDWIVANQVGGERSAMEGDENEIILLAKAGDRQEFGPASKREVARFILEHLQVEERGRAASAGDRSNGH
jgi:phosphopantothenoylcysteine synthetase/decarboxylase